MNWHPRGITPPLPVRDGIEKWTLPFCTRGAKTAEEVPETEGQRRGADFTDSDTLFFLSPGVVLLFFPGRRRGRERYNSLLCCLCFLSCTEP